MQHCKLGSVPVTHVWYLGTPNGVQDACKFCWMSKFQSKVTWVKLQKPCKQKVLTMELLYLPHSLHWVNCNECNISVVAGVDQSSFEVSKGQITKSGNHEKKIL